MTAEQNIEHNGNILCMPAVSVKSLKKDCDYNFSYFYLTPSFYHVFVVKGRNTLYFQDFSI